MSGGLIDTTYVRIRPLLHGFKSEATAGVKAGLTAVQAEVAASARANVAAVKEEIAANKMLAASYLEIASLAKKGSEEQIVAADLAAAATVRAERRMVVGAEEAGLAAEHLKHHFLSIGHVLGIGFGAEILIEFTKHVSESAASIQKSLEVIRHSFGKDASEVVVQFNDTTAAALGISAEAANATSARFGILFKNLGIAPELASKMTINLEKLAGSLSAIRGVDPSRALSTITLAMLGNVRSLKQLGLAVDPATEKIAAFKLGLLSSVHDALTPAVRAEAIYALATRNLGDFQQQAVRHQNDAINVQRRLSAEWSNAKDIIGTALLPAFEKASLGLGDWFEKMIRTGELQRDVNKVVGDASAVFTTVVGAIKPVVGLIKDLSGALGGTRETTKDLIALWAGWKLAGMITSFAKLGREARFLRLQMLGLAGIGTIVITLEIIGLEKAKEAIKNLQEQVIDAQSHTAKKGERVRSTLIPDLADDIKRYKAQGLESAEIIGRLRDKLGGNSAVYDKAIADAKKKQIDLAKEFGIDLKGRTPDIPQKDFDAAREAANFSDNADSIIADAFAFSRKGSAQAKRLATEFAANAVGHIKKAVKKEAETTAPVEIPLPIKIAAADANAIKLARQGIADLKTKLRQALQQNELDLVAAIDQAKQSLVQIGGTLASTIGSAIEEPFNVANRQISEAQNRLALMFDTKNAALEAQQRRLSRLQAALGARTDRRALENLRQQVVLPGGGGLSTDPKKAIAQLQELAKTHRETRGSVEQFLEKYQAAVLAIRSDVLGKKTAAVSDAQAAATTPLTLRSDRLRIRQDAAERRKTAITRQISELTTELAGHEITLGQFNKRIAKVLAADGTSYRKAGALLGVSFREGFEAQVKGLLDQAEALAASPVRPGNGQEPTIVRPLLTLEKQTREVGALTRQIGNKQIALQLRIAKATEKAAKAAEKQAAAIKTLASVKLGPTALDLMPGAQSKKTAALTGTGG